ncbi:MAG: M81 family metallopeptidase [Achromobacter sp.]
MSLSSSGPRIAILGFAIESNRFAPISTRDDFETRAYLSGDALMTDARSDAPAMTPEIPAFVRNMDAAGAWTPLPILFANAESGGPVEHGFFADTLSVFEAGLRAALPLDAVYICEHGAAITTQSDDPDGEVFALVRRIVGDAVPVVATVDLHANVSDLMIDSVDTLISYRRNPHVDMAERGADAACVVRELMCGGTVAVAHLRMPVCAPPTQLLTAPGTGPYADMIEAAEALLDDPRIINISAVAGFVYGDTPKNGMTVIVTTRDDAAFARQTALDLAMPAWHGRSAFSPALTSLEHAVEMARDAGANPRLPALCLADVADNPGGGGRGNTPYLLQALLAADAQHVIMGVITDAALCAQSQDVPIGASFTARFNQDDHTLYSDTFETQAVVVRRHTGQGVGRRGQLAGCRFDLGPSVLLQIGGIKVVVISNRHQCHEPMFLEMFGLDIGAARTVVVKSRGHFRAAFDEFFKPAQIYSVDAPGLTSPVLARCNFQRLPRPVVPMDDMDTWSPNVRVLTKRQLT